MTVLIGRRESFSAAHQLCDPDLSDAENRRLFGKCANLHGHIYILEVVVAGEIDQPSGYVLDLKLLSDIIGRQVIREVDHRNPLTETKARQRSGHSAATTWPTACPSRSRPGWPARCRARPWTL